MGFSYDLNISIVILHFNNAEMTSSYIGNIQKLNWININYQIIIVDNASPDKSGCILAEKYESAPNIEIIQSKENKGFARGNNLGINLALTKYDSDLIIVSNSDIIIDDYDLPQKLVSIYNRTAFDVYGPDIYSINRNYHQNPVRERYLEINDLHKKINNINKTLRLLHIIDMLKLYDFLSYIKRKIHPADTDAHNYDKYQEGVVLQGAFFVLTKRYLSVYPDGLYPNTFLYMEEDILNYRTVKKGLKSVYDPNISVKHIDGASTRMQAGSRCKKYINGLIQTKDSCLEMIKYISS